MGARDRELGMQRAISRRDFLNGVALGGASALLLPRWLLALERGEAAPTGPYPPALTGLRGSHEGSYEVAHALKDGSFWKTAGEPLDTGERYDLVVVGAGLSGLSAARFYRQRAGAGARVLLLDNHDDFGGHARRNEWSAEKRLLLGYGGTQSIDSPAPYSEVARTLIADLGVDVASFRRHVDGRRDAGLGRGLFFDKATFGADLLLPSPLGDRGGEHGDRRELDLAWRRFRAEAPLSEAARKDVERLYTGRRDYLPGLDSQAKKGRLARLSYASYLRDVVGCDEGVLKLLQTRPHGLYGVGIDAMPAQDAWGLGFPGFQGLGLDAAPGVGMNRDSIPNAAAEGYYFHFPDGNATLARLLVRELVPGSIPGRGAEDVVTARADYSRLDRAEARTRLRLESTVVRVRHLGARPGEGDVEVAYVQGGRLCQVRARHCVLACWHVVIPHLFPELPDEQKRALADMVKVPIVYTNVVLRRFAPLRKLGVRAIDAPGGYFSELNADPAVSVGTYKAPAGADEPVVVHMMRTPCSPGLPAREQHRAGRLDLFGTSFETFERHVRDQLGRMLGAGGFDPAADILGLTVNRWPHGYAYQYNSLWDAFWRDGRLDEQPCVRARRPLGSVAIANADAGAYAYTDCAIDQAHRAVLELLGPPGGA